MSALPLPITALPQALASSEILLPPEGALAGAGIALGAYAALGVFAAASWWDRLRGPRAAPQLPEDAFPFTVEDCVHAADRAIGEERWPAAAEWLGRAHRLAPTSARVCADLAFALRQIGDLEGALAMYEKASRCAQDDGEPFLHGALTSLAAQRPLEEAEEWLARALAIEPSLVVVVEDEQFKPLRGRPRFEAALQRARLATAGDDSG